MRDYINNNEKGNDYSYKIKIIHYEKEDFPILHS